MRCNACNTILSSSESVRKFKDSLTFVDLCNKCLHTISDEVEVVEGSIDYDEEDLDPEWPDS